MPKWQYALETGGKKSLQVSTGQRWGNTELRLDGELVGTIATRKELATGKAFTLQDGEVLQVQLVRNELLISCNNVPAVAAGGGPRGPAARLVAASGLMCFLGALNVLLGGIAQFMHVEYLQTIHYGTISIVVGFVLVVLGLLMRTRLMSVAIVSLVASSASAVTMVIVGVLASLEHAENTADSDIRLRVLSDALQYGAIPIGIFVGSVVVLVSVGMGVGAVKKLKEERQSDVT
jgi:hypothetical protein